MARAHRETFVDGEAMDRYHRYQEKYQTTVRESDKVLIELVRRCCDGPATLIDLGCSTGNLLRHMRGLLPDVTLTGVDIVDSVVAENQANATLEGIEFFAMDILQAPAERTFDVAVTNASLLFFDVDQLNRAAESIAGLVKPGGAYVGFEFLHPFAQEITVVEHSDYRPDGLTFYFRSFGKFRAAFEAAGFEDVEFTPFHVPIELPRGADDDLTTYSVDSSQGRLSYRGCLGQPWCHVRARRRA